LQAGGLEQAERQSGRAAERQSRQNGGQSGGQAGWLAGWNGGQATGRSIQAVAKTGRGRPIMTEIIGAGKFRAS